MSKWNDFIADRKIRVERYECLPPGSGQYCWYVIEDVDDPCDFNNWGRLADGFADEASAQAWLEEYRLEEQCREWRRRRRQRLATTMKLIPACRFDCGGRRACLRTL